ncbi:hypothetical protein LS68_008115 [Helicobacter sp. MIT 05-5293]|uniref:GPW/gp25 family protein n=1 Tax=Helicobacter sp. MIT 05-5293 TaxID=1548149 RepID=UPI00068E4FA3|nr:GPW/gp25 family protein [Helicobacter sp. MIT 05-5293]TLD80173.1 hypothetical protein LS68_008115 [Helicobacter sp. MIT 05-5293]
MYQISVEQNLQRILTTHKFTLPLCPNFGLSDSYIDKPLTQDLMLELKDEILEQIALYEPRIKVSDITLAFKDSVLTLHIRTQEENLTIELS